MPKEAERIFLNLSTMRLTSNNGAALCIALIIIELSFSLFEYGKLVKMGAPYGANHFEFLNRHLPCDLSPRFEQDWLSGQSYFVINSPGLYSQAYYWRKTAETEDLLSYRVNETDNTLILEEFFETDSVGQRTVYHNTTPVKQNHVYIQISLDTVSTGIIYKEEEIQPENIDQWESLDVIQISPNIWSIKDILICKRRLNLRIILLALLLAQSLYLFKKHQSKLLQIR